MVATWSTWLKAGHQRVYALQVEGIATIFDEREIWGIDDNAAAAPEGYSFSHALRITDRTSYSIEPNRERGLAAGRAVEFLLGRETLADDGLTTALFVQPTLVATLTADLEAYDTSIAVDTTSSWPSSGALNLGRERITYASKTGTTFDGLTRGVCGYVHYHSGNGIGGYREATDVPRYWRGRFVTLWEHLVSPEGRYLSGTLCTLGDYCRQAWRGFIADTPRPDHGGFVLRALPLVRLGDIEVGADVSGSVVRGGDGFPAIVWEAADVIRITEIGGATDAVVPADGPSAANNGIVDLTTWCARAAAEFNNGYSPDRVQIQPRDGGVGVLTRWSTSTNATRLFADAWFLDRGIADYPGGIAWRTLPYAWANGPGLLSGGWLVCALDASADYTGALVPEDGGLLLLEIDGVKEVVEYDQVRTSTAGLRTAFRIIARGLMGTRPTGNPWLSETRVAVIAGAAGRWLSVFKTIATSSGTGLRGASDTQPPGFGLGIPESWIDIDALYAPDAHVVAVTTESRTIEKMLCGWLALNRACLIQKRNADGEIVLTVVSTDVAEDTRARELSVSDLLLDGQEIPALIEGPNHVKIGTSSTLREMPTYVIRDAIRAQSEGVRSIDIEAAGASAVTVLQLGAELILLSDGQAIVKARLPAWEDQIQPGDALQVTTGHPSIYDWQTGEWGPALVFGRVLAVERSLWTEITTIEILLEGHARRRTMLCPCAIVTEVVSATEYRVARGDSLGFLASDVVWVYSRGDDDDGVERTIVSVTEGTTYDTIIIDTAPALAGSEIVFTYPYYSSSNTRQRRHLYALTGKYWR